MSYLILIFLGLALGSFINASVWRIHEQESSKKKLKDPKLSIVKGRSMCPDCNHELSAKDLIPVFSWLSLGGKCRYCKQPISWQYPLVELATALLFVVFYWASDDMFNKLGIFPTVSYFVIICGLVALFVYDLRWMILPNRIIFPLIALSVAVRLYDFVVSDFDFQVIISAALGALVLGGLFYVLFTLSKGRWIGGGDVKYGIFVGILLGPALSYLVLLISSFLGSIVILSLMALKIVKRSQQVPFGPFLITGTFIAMTWGQSVIDWYVEVFLGL